MDGGQLNDKALESWKAGLPLKSRAALTKSLTTLATTGQAEKLRILLDTVTLSTEKGKGLFGKPPEGTIHPNSLDEAIVAAAEADQDETIRILAAAGGNPATGKQAPLRIAGHAANTKAILALVECGADIDNAIANTQTWRAHKVLEACKNLLNDAQTAATPAAGKPADGWAAMGDSCIAFSESAAQGPGLTMIFNFKAREVATVVIPADKTVPVSPTVRSFAEFGNAALIREAEEKLVAANGGKPLKFRV